jgi:hypothetical protein
MEMPIAEVLDRYSILLLKIERTRCDFSEEYDQYHNAVKDYRDLYSGDGVDGFIGRLVEVNGKIWDMESDIRSGKEGKFTLEEVGKRAIAIRNINNERVKIKNEIANHYKSGFIEIKINHASA